MVDLKDMKFGVEYGRTSATAGMSLQNHAYENPAIPKEVREQFKAANPAGSATKVLTANIVRLNADIFLADVSLMKKETDGVGANLRIGLTGQVGGASLIDTMFTAGAGAVASVVVNGNGWAESGWNVFAKATIDGMGVSGKDVAFGANKTVDLHGYLTTVTLRAGISKELFCISDFCIGAQVNGGYMGVLDGKMGSADITEGSWYVGGGLEVTAEEELPAPLPPPAATPAPAPRGRRGRARARTQTQP